MSHCAAVCTIALQGLLQPTCILAQRSGDKQRDGNEGKNIWSRILGTEASKQPVQTSEQPTKASSKTVVNCNALTECNRDGFDASRLGNGICNDNDGECYNTNVCGYDSGDCLIFQKSACQEDILSLLPSSLHLHDNGDYDGLSVIWNGDSSKRHIINCNRLTRCDWPGVQRKWLGDNVCDDITACYGEKICNCDEGDCNVDQLEKAPETCDALSALNWCCKTRCQRVLSACFCQKAKC